MAGSMAYRLPVGAPAAPEMVTFRAVMRASEGITDNRGYNFIAGFHGAPFWFCWHHQFNPRVPTRSQLFLPWHRAYLWWLEQSLRDIEDGMAGNGAGNGNEAGNGNGNGNGNNGEPADTGGTHDGVALPWWDWTADRNIPEAYADEEADGGPNPLFGTRALVPNADPPIDQFTQRRPGANPRVRLPTVDAVNRLLDEQDWSSFSDLLEDMHDSVHVWVGGDMMNVTTAAYDPIFFAHHCMIDRIWYLWQVRHGSGGIPVALLDLELIPFGKRFRDVLDVQSLGYEYALSTTQIRIGAGNDA